jgi:archaellum component FlaF (FlaF/FlaG flagellin family)
MKTTILSLSVLMIAFFSVNENAFAQKKEKDKVLANKVYTIDLTETGGKKTPKPESDEISFKSDKLNSKYMTTEYKFPAAAYTVTVDSSSAAKEITFSSLGKNQDDEEIKWDGTVTDDAIEGTAVISKKGKTKKEYSFTGTLKEKPGKKK